MNRFGKTFGRADSAKAQSAAYLSKIAARLESQLDDKRAFVENWQAAHMQARNAACEGQKYFRACGI
jgi:hypothetical protein